MRPTILRLLCAAALLAAAAPQKAECALRRGRGDDSSLSKQEDKKKNKEEEKKKVSHLRMTAQRMATEGEGKRSRSMVAGKVTEHKVVCPACQFEFAAWDVDAQDFGRGIDRDFCKHSSEMSADDLDVWCCARCGYAALKTHFAIPLEPAFVQEVPKRITPFFLDITRRQLGLDLLNVGFFLDQPDMPSIIKYHMMEQCLGGRNYSSFQKMRFYLQFAWTERRRLISPITNAALSIKISIMQNRLLAYKKKVSREDEPAMEPEELLEFLDYTEKNFTLDRDDRLLLTIYKAGQLDRLGFCADALKHLGEMEKLEFDKGVRDTLAFKKSVLEHEFELLKKALVFLHEAMRDGEVPADRIPEYAYLCGELDRRIGLTAEASLWLDMAETITREPELLHTWVREQKSLLPPKAGDKAEKSTEVEALLVERMRGEYLSYLGTAPKKEADPAARELRETEARLGIIQRAIEEYRKAFDTYPSGLQEIKDVELLRDHADLERTVLERFALILNPLPRPGENSYLVASRIPFLDSLGKYWPAMGSGQNVVLLRNPPIAEE